MILYRDMPQKYGKYFTFRKNIAEKISPIQLKNNKN
jgi:hypothetical protein